MGTVYLGRVQATGRLVAVKVVRSELADDPEYRARFRREAQVARRVARFCTAEVLAVADPPNAAPYLVTEFIAGRTLADAVAVHGPLESADVERVAVSVAAALTAIHGAGLVHRDLKPSNVLLSPLGPRVIDFGIAWAVDSSTITKGKVLGTPAFMAPEQARGAPVSTAADVFAWGGLTVFASTGRPPFGTGSMPALLYRIVTTDVVLDGLDPGLAAIVRDAMRRDPAQRPTAEEIFGRMTRLGVRLDSTPGAPDDQGAGFVAARDAIAAVDATDDDDAAAAATAAADAGTAEVEVLTDLAASGRARAAGPAARRSGRRGVLVTIIALSALVVLGAVAVAIRGALGDGTTSTGTGTAENLTVPAGLIGLTADDAQGRLRTVGFVHVERVSKPDADAAAGRVIDVNPAGGSDVRRSTKVVLTVSAGDDDVVIPDVVGRTEAAARAALERLGLTVVVGADVPTARPGQVTAVHPTAGTAVAPGSTVTITVAAGAAPGGVAGTTTATMPNVVGQPADRAREILAGAGFTDVSSTDILDDHAARDTVLRSEPTAGTTVDPSTRVVLTVSGGPGHTTVADVVGRSEADARSALTTAGLDVTVRVQDGPSSIGPGLVEKVEPAAGTQLPPRTTVTITVVSGEISVPDVVGRARAQAEATLSGYGLDVVVQRQASERPTGTVLAQAPEAGTVRRGTTVTLTVASPVTGSSTPPPQTPPPASS
ncbi:PASTA domain-containing protein [Frankia sp. AiPs1]|uniref:Stk1 family PASTA domain-containing Ser/Thr kinase n=1 Tax=Frankia sp. AiPs1 TaxID=573493 RepID=UPI00204446A5|nr:Stk1 family PASTA domain-containing Ser/Thr kinase [Frankia sp. AiPs1]MCM3922168.1 PASTA domain-containing protein [Frankia sp. AiPs1]